MPCRLEPCQMDDIEAAAGIHGWRLLSVLHARVEAQLERVPQGDISSKFCRTSDIGDMDFQVES